MLTHNLILTDNVFESSVISNLSKKKTNKKREDVVVRWETGVIMMSVNTEIILHYLRPTNMEKKQMFDRNLKIYLRFDERRETRKLNFY